MDGVPAGLPVDMDYINNEMKRRAPGQSLSTPRKEQDIPEILSGVLDDHTTGAPLTAIIRNTNTRSQDYSNLKNVPRPSHADYTGSVKYNSFNDIRGGGHFSGRLTAPLVFAGSILRQELERKGIIITSHIKSIHGLEDDSLDSMSMTNAFADSLRAMPLPVINASMLTPFIMEIENAKASQDSVGGVIEGGIYNLPAGIGEPMFQSVESQLSSMLFSIPGVKGVEFGEGFNITRLHGSQANDQFIIKDGQVATSTNYSGGIQGGITNGMPVILRAAIKPTASIGKSQRSVNLTAMEETSLEIKGRHDPCIALRALPVLEAVCAIVIFDLLLESRSI
jgi:chorismate synthase